MMVMPVVSASWLKEQLDSKASIVLLDVTWYSAKDGYQTYLQKHIPGSIWFNIMNDVQNTELFPRNIPEVEKFQNYCQSLGVDSDSHIVVYDNIPEQCGFFIGSRAWWLFRLFGHDQVSVLDGGLSAWERLGFPTTADVPNKSKEGNFKAEHTPSVIRVHEEMKENLSRNRLQICDTRALEKYNGDPRDPKTGHYPGAVATNLVSILLDKNMQQLKTKEQLKEVFSARGVDLDKPVVGMCNSGMSSCSVALSAFVCGAKDVSVYLGGFTEWSKKAQEGEIEQSTE